MLCKWKAFETENLPKKTSAKLSPPLSLAYSRSVKGLV